MERTILTNSGVVLLAKAGYTEGFILDMIQLKHTRFDVTPEGLAALAETGLTERIVRAMVAKDERDKFHESWNPNLNPAAGVLRTSSGPSGQ